MRCAPSLAAVMMLLAIALAARAHALDLVVIVHPTRHEMLGRAEIAQIERFCQAMQLDWGGLDVLRERETGRLYVVDVNKTDTGPAVVLSWKDRARATTLLSEALGELASGR